MLHIGKARPARLGHDETAARRRLARKQLRRCDVDDVAWLAACLAVWLAGWLAVWLCDWLVVWLPGWTPRSRRLPIAARSQTERHVDMSIWLSPLCLDLPTGARPADHVYRVSASTVSPHNCNLLPRSPSASRNP